MMDSGFGIDKANQIAASIYTQYSSFIRKIIESRLDDENQIEDVFQNLFLDIVIRPIPHNVKNIKSYLYRATIKCVAEKIRQTTCMEFHTSKFAESMATIATMESPETAMIDAEETAKKFALIRKQLSYKEFTAIALYYKDNRSVEEIATIMDVKIATVRRYMARAYDRIRNSCPAELFAA